MRKTAVKSLWSGRGPYNAQCLVLKIMYDKIYVVHKYLVFKVEKLDLFTETKG